MADRELRTLDHWRSKLSRAPQTIECSAMRLIGRDHEGDIFKGVGRIEIRSNTEMRFYMHAAAIDDAVAFRKLRSARENPYDTLEQFRLIATDYSGVEWNGGWTTVDFFTDAKKGWPLSGELTTLVTLAKGNWVAKKSGVELLLIPPLKLPTNEWMVSTTSISETEILSSRSPGRQKVCALGTEIEFAYEPSDDALWITAATSDSFQHPYAENWLTQPLRIMLGSLIYPRMVARNMGDGRAHVWLRPSPRHERRGPFGLMQPFGVTVGHNAAFWELYSKILTFIGSARDQQGSPYFDPPHIMTQLYEELAQSQHGSRWMMQLTLASAAEAMAKNLMTDADKKSDYPESDICSLKKHILQWKDNKDLRGRVMSDLNRAAERGVQGFMRKLTKSGVLDVIELDSWISIRNSVMHGELHEPWSTPEGDKHLMAMTSLVHKLTHAFIDKV